MFQSTHPHGVRPHQIFFAAQYNGFQSTHPHGVRQDLPFHQAKGTGFNPRTHTGCDAICGYLKAGRNVSIHAPTRGATDSAQKVISTDGVSIHAPTRGATEPSDFPCCGGMFQSTHPHGVRHCRSEQRRSPIQVSIHAPTRGATRLEQTSKRSSSVSIHAPTRGATP